MRKAWNNRVAGVLSLTLGVLVSLILSGSAEAKVGVTTFDRMTDSAEAVLTGRVVRILLVPIGEAQEDGEEQATIKVAEVQVLEWWKGQARPVKVWFLAESTWACDATHAVLNESALFFLRSGGNEDPGFRSDGVFNAPQFQSRLKKVTGGAPLRILCFSGYGRMPIDEVQGVEYAACWTSHVRLPTCFRTIPGPDPRYSGMERRVPVAECRLRIQKRVDPARRPASEKIRVVFDALRMLYGEMDVHYLAKETLEGLSPEVIPLLFKILEAPGDPWRGTAAEAMPWLGEAGLMSLLAGLRSEDPVRRRASAFAFEWGPDFHASLVGDLIPTFKRASMHDDPEVRARMVSALGRWGMEVAFDVVARALADESPEVRRSAARSIVRPRWTIDTSENSPPAKVESGLLAMTDDEDVHVRREAWEALTYLSGPATVPAAMRALDDEDSVVRVSAMLALARSPTEDAARRLASLLESDDPWTRRSAAYALGAGKMAIGVGALVKALEDRDDIVIETAVEALNNIGPSAAAALPALEGLLEKTPEFRRRNLIKSALRDIRGE